jgi:hypothetical protein
VANQFSEESYFQNNNYQQIFLTERKLNWSTWYISPNKVTGFLLKTIACLILLHFVEKIAINWLNDLTNLQLSTHYFDFDSEGNFPSLYSALALGLCSLLLALISQIKRSIQSRERFAPRRRNSLPQRSDQKYWTSLAYIFLYLALDEFCSIHELLIPIIRQTFHTQGLLYFPWTIVGFIFVVIFLITFRHFIYNLPSKTKMLFLIAGGLYIIGVLGMEVVDGYIGNVIGFNTKAYWITSTITVK